MTAVGDMCAPQLQVPDADPGTQVTLTIVDGDDEAAQVPVSADAAGTAFTAPPFPFPSPGEWRLTWTVTGPGSAAGRTEVVYVEPDPNTIPDTAGGSFATSRELADYSGQPPGPGDRRRLLDASREIERMTKTARYAIDSTGRPSDPLIRTALRDACCELIGWWAETGLDTGARGLYTSASIAGVSLGMGGAQTANTQADRVGPRVWTILLNAGLIRPGAVMS